MTNVFAPYIADKYPTVPVKAVLWAPPRGGNEVWRDFVNSLPNLNFWRYVHEHDPVPRLPLNAMSFYHAGHLIDINENDAKAYYQQTGNDVYAGVPPSWNCKFASVSLVLFILTSSAAHSFYFTSSHLILPFFYQS